MGEGGGGGRALILDGIIEPGSRHLTMGWGGEGEGEHL